MRGSGGGQGLWSGAKVVRCGVVLRVVEECHNPVSSCPRSGPGIASLSITHIMDSSKSLIFGALHSFTISH